MQTKPWLNEMSWDALASINQTLCETQNVPVQPGKNQDKARQLWERTYTKSMALAEALDFCKECNRLAPFTFNNGNTFATASRKMVEDWIQSLPSYEAHMLRTGVGHYVNGMISKKEMLDTLRHAEITRKTATKQSEAGR